MTIAVKNRKPIVVSSAALRRAGFKSGQELEVKISGGAITILPKVPVSDDAYTSAERRAIDRGIAASEKDYKEGRSYGPFETHAEFVASLHQEAGKLRRKQNKRSAK